MFGSWEPEEAEVPLISKYLGANKFVLLDAFVDRHTPSRQHSRNKSFALLAQQLCPGLV